MPIARRATPPTSQIKEHLSVLSSLSAWTDDGADEMEEEEKPRGTTAAGYQPLEKGPNGEEAPAPPPPSSSIFAMPDVDGDYFNMFVGIVILTNAVVIGLETDFGRSYFLVLEHAFNCVFFFEMVMRMVKSRAAYFCELWNVFDFSLVLIGTLDLWIMPIVVQIQGGSDTDQTNLGYKLTTLRLLRILRLMRVLRVIRLFRMFQQLNLILQAFQKAFQIVGLISLLVAILDYVLAILLTQAVGQQAHKWGHHEAQIKEWFGTISQSMVTLFGIMTLTNWSTVASVLAEEIAAPIVFLFFVLYITVTSYTMVSLITGIITESLITSQADYQYKKLQTFDKKRRSLREYLLDFLNDVLNDDMDKEGTVSHEDLKTSVRGDTNMLTKLAEIDISITENGVLGLIDQLSFDGTTRVDVSYFVDKLTNLTGLANASAIADVKYEVAKTEKQILFLDKQLEAIMTRAYPETRPTEEGASQSTSFSPASYGSSPGKRSSLRQKGAVQVKPKGKMRFAEGED
eukprot:TRINITY_DN8047_c0_g1_i1.p1 TRINITY_DN8047_c0_g1~~TRINITY_DN8047_c0_g1_i1.p1  ORF type:complete len:514 (+),score=126.76 TRINITY_DN8047_c0_g1_i1:150-1691(+)